DFRRGNEHGRGIKLLARRLIHRREWPQPRRTPGVEHVGVLLPIRTGRIDLALDLFAAIPNRDLMAPPELPADAPILQIGHPMIVNFCPALREKSHLAALHDFASGFGARMLHEPLLGKTRLNGHSSPLPMAD